MSEKDYKEYKEAATSLMTDVRVRQVYAILALAEAIRLSGETANVDK